jgi:hypothetical protein
MNTKTTAQSKLIPMDDYDEEEEEEEYDDEVDDANDILYDDPIDIKRPALPGLKSNGIRIASVHLDSVLFIGFLFSICFL